jgi:hypothetical protein
VDIVGAGARDGGAEAGEGLDVYAYVRDLTSSPTGAQKGFGHLVANDGRWAVEEKPAEKGLAGFVIECGITRPSFRLPTTETETVLARRHREDKGFSVHRFKPIVHVMLLLRALFRQRKFFPSSPPTRNAAPGDDNSAAGVPRTGPGTE